MVFTVMMLLLRCLEGMATSISTASCHCRLRLHPLRAALHEIVSGCKFLSKKRRNEFCHRSAAAHAVMAVLY